MRRENMVGSGKRHSWIRDRRVWRGATGILPVTGQGQNGRATSEGFTLIEALVSVAIIGIVMGPIFFFLLQVQKRFQGNSVTSEANQGARAAMAAMAQEIGQAGFNPQFTASTTSSTSLAPNGSAQCITLAGPNGTTGINPGDYLTIDKGSQFEQVKVAAVSNSASTVTKLSNFSTLYSGTPCTPGAANQVSAQFMQCHSNNSGTNGCSTTLTTGAYPVISYKFPYASGILQSQSVTYNGSTISLSTDHILAMYYGSQDNSGTVYYVVYSLYNPTSSTPQTVYVGGNPYKLYTLWRSVDTLTFATGQTTSHAYPLVDNVVYQDITGSTPLGPTGQQLFTYKTQQVTVVPNVVTVVGTVIININVAISPQNMEYQNYVTVSGTRYPIAQYFTMASQIRPVNLWAAVAINSTGGADFLPPMPLGIPLSFPGTMAGYYF